MIRSTNDNLFDEQTTDADRFLYDGHDFDPEVELLYHRARHYDPTVGRWISEDPIGFSAGDSNLYRYVGNQPTHATDPSGLITTDEDLWARFEAFVNSHEALLLKQSAAYAAAWPVLSRQINRYSPQEILDFWLKGRLGKTVNFDETSPFTQWFLGHKATNEVRTELFAELNSRLENGEDSVQITKSTGYNYSKDPFTGLSTAIWGYLFAPTWFIVGSFDIKATLEAECHGGIVRIKWEFFDPKTVHSALGTSDKGVDETRPFYPASNSDWYFRAVEQWSE